MLSALLTIASFEIEENFCYAFCHTEGNAMSKKANEVPQEKQSTGNWTALLDEMRADYWATSELTDEEKRFLDELEFLSEEKWEPIPCPGTPLSEIIIEERGTR